MPERPLSPFLTVYKFKYTLATSILNRFAGLVLSAGLVILVYWLVALASGVHAYAQARAHLSLGVMKILYAALLAAFAYHLLAGIRHLVWDTGACLEKKTAERSAWLLAGVGIALALVLIYLFLRPAAYAR
jgi:succinate dehydrogenase / fumarate reductase cytochrome b subunit